MNENGVRWQRIGDDDAAVIDHLRTLVGETDDVVERIARHHLVGADKLANGIALVVFLDHHLLHGGDHLHIRLRGQRTEGKNRQQPARQHMHHTL